MHLAHVVVAIPTHNNEERIGTILLKTRSKYSNILVVDNASDDDTVRIANAAGADIVRHPMTLGKSAVYRSVIRAAMEMGPEVLVVLNGSGYCNPDEIPSVLDPVLNGEAEVVECAETGFAAYSGSVLHSLMVQGDRIIVEESLLKREPKVKVLVNKVETSSQEEVVGKLESGG
jgi:glycosyltransferase involved in cell wall biosynthesis